MGYKKGCVMWRHEATVWTSEENRKALENFEQSCEIT